MIDDREACACLRSDGGTGAETLHHSIENHAVNAPLDGRTMQSRYAGIAFERHIEDLKSSDRSSSYNPASPVAQL